MCVMNLEYGIIMLKNEQIMHINNKMGILYKKEVVNIILQLLFLLIFIIVVNFGKCLLTGRKILRIYSC